MEGEKTVTCSEENSSCLLEMTHYTASYFSYRRTGSYARSTFTSKKIETKMLQNESIRVVSADEKQKGLLINTNKKWKAKPRVMLVSTIISLCLFGFAAYLIKVSYLRSRDSENGNTIQSEIDYYLSYPLCGNTSSAHACSSSPLCRTTSRIRRIIGGSKASISNWPWMAELVYQEKHYCGAVLLSLNILLTAAHCLYHNGNRLYTDDLQVRLGSKYRVSNEKQYQSLFVAQIFIHESFKLSSLESDVAIIVLESGMKLTNSIWPICISEDHHIQDGTSVTMTGWGKTSYEGSFSDILKEATVPIVDAVKCKKSNANLFKGVDVNIDNNICAGYGKLKNTYGCNGDSGGPLMKKSLNNKWLLIGIMSWGGPSCSSIDNNSYTVFTKIQPYKKWISNILRLVAR